MLNLRGVLMGLVNDPGPMALAGTEDEDSLREIAREHAIQSGMLKEFAVTYALGCVEAHMSIGNSGSEALAFARGYAGAILQHPNQQDEETALTAIGQLATVHFPDHPERAAAFKNGYSRAFGWLKSTHNPSAAKAYAYGYAAVIERMPPINQETHPAEVLRAAANTLA